MRVFLTGGTGFVGHILTPRLIEAGHEVTVTVRPIKKAKPAPEGAKFLVCETTQPGTWQAEVSKHDAIINLAGASIFRRWTAEGKRLIVESRVLTTTNLVDALPGGHGPGIRFLSISGIGYYGHHGDEWVDEEDPPGTDFLAQLAAQWESAASRAREYGASLALCRLGNVLGKDGGMLSKLVMVSRLRLGSQWGNGRQWLSWVHEQDMADIFLLLLQHREIEGPVNVSAPEPVQNVDMMKLLREQLGVRTFVPRAPGFLLRLLTGEFAGVFLNGQRVRPEKLLETGYSFKYPYVGEALASLLSS